MNHEEDEGLFEKLFQDSPEDMESIEDLPYKNIKEALDDLPKPEKQDPKKSRFYNMRFTG